MIIRCPNCEYSRTININSIPPTAELATCPKCKRRFRFRTLTAALDEAEEAARVRREPSPPPRPRSEAPTPSGSQGMDVWDAVDALNQQWERQMEQNVTEVVTPQPGTFNAQDAVEEPEQPAEPYEHEIPVHELPEHPEENPAPQAAHDARDGSAPLPQDAVESCESAGPAVFPYANDDTTPEERVERDIRLLRGSADRPLRDLGRLDDHVALGGSDGKDHGDGGDIPWEMPEKYGWIQAFVKTVHEVMFNAPSFFSRLRPSGSLASEYLFFLILGYIAILGSVAWTKTALFLIPSLHEDANPGVSLPVMLLLAPLALGLMQVFVTGGIRLIQQLFASEQAEFSLVFKVVSYAVAPLVLSVAPFVGPVVGAIWFLISLFIGCRHSLGLSWQLAVAVPLLPALILIYGVSWYFL